MRDAEWKAIIHNDSSYDGKFFYAVKTTGVVCRPSCKSRVPIRDNAVVFGTVDAALVAGFRPCKRCKPDDARYPADELVHSVMEYVDAHYSDPLTLSVIGSALHVNVYHLHHIFKQVSGTTPAQYILHKRIEKAMELLRETSSSVTDIAVSVGFVNAAHFSTVFRKQTGVTPTVYRKQV